MAEIQLERLTKVYPDGTLAVSSLRRTRAGAGGAAGEASDPSKRQRSRGPHVLMQAPQAVPEGGAWPRSSSSG